MKNLALLTEPLLFKGMVESFFILNFVCKNINSWAEVQTKVLEGRREPFSDLEELETQIKTIWEATSNQDKLHRAIK